MSKAVGIIPARWGSTRFAGKPLYPIAGKPLLRHVWERCCKAEKLDSVIIATDDMRIAEAAFEWGAEVALTSRHHRSGTDRIAEVARNAREFDYVVNIQGDEPLIEPGLINRLVEQLRENRRIKMVTAAHPFANPADATSPHQVKVMIDSKYRAVYFSRLAISAFPSRNGGFPDLATGKRGTRRPLFLRHQGIYGFRREILLQFVRWKPSPLERAESLEQLRALENGVTVHVLVTKHGWPGVDTPKDAKVIAASLGEKSRRPTKQSTRRVARTAATPDRRRR